MKLLPVAVDFEPFPVAFAGVLEALPPVAVALGPTPCTLTTMHRCLSGYVMGHHHVDVRSAAHAA